MGKFYKRTHYCSANTCVISAKLQVQAWQLVKSASPAAGSAKWVSVLPPEELWNFYRLSQGGGKPSCVSEGRSFSATCPWWILKSLPTVNRLTFVYGKIFAGSLWITCCFLKIYTIFLTTVQTEEEANLLSMQVARLTLVLANLDSVRINNCKKMTISLSSKPSVLIPPASILINTFYFILFYFIAFQSSVKWIITFSKFSISTIQTQPGI